jgi:hypothetical protein
LEKIQCVQLETPIEINVRDESGSEPHRHTGQLIDIMTIFHRIVHINMIRECVLSLIMPALFWISRSLLKNRAMAQQPQKTTSGGTLSRLNIDRTPIFSKYPHDHHCTIKKLSQVRIRIPEELPDIITATPSHSSSVIMVQQHSPRWT